MTVTFCAAAIMAGRHFIACKPAAATSTCDPIAVDSDDVAFTVEQPTCFRVVSN